MRQAAIPQDVFARWTEELARAVRCLGGDDFPEVLSSAIRTLVACDCSLILAYHARKRPAVLFDDFEHPLRRNDIKAYLRGAYLLDPLFQAALACRQAALVRLRDVAPPEFERSAYYVDYYKGSEVSDEINFFAPVEGEICLAVSLERAANNPAFSDSEVALFGAIIALVAEMLDRHWSLSTLANELAGTDLEHERLVSRLGRLGEGMLTDREKEITQMVLKGHSNHSIADILGLSVETVKVHRRNIYRKLNISSVSELYSAALNQVMTSA